MLTKTSKLSELQCKVEDLEFKTKRQKNQIEDLDNTLTRNRVSYSKQLDFSHFNYELKSKNKCFRIKYNFTFSKK